MKVFFESDRECTIDGVGLLEPGQLVEVDPTLFFAYHGVKPGEANLPDYIQVSVDVTNGGEEV